MGVDVGTVRIGVAASDPHGVLATPVETVPRGDDGSDIARLVAIVAEREAILVAVGLPLALSGRVTASTRDAVGFARALRDALEGVEVRVVDERLSTVSASQALRSSGRRSKEGRSVIDQAAAVIILQSALDAERVSGRPAGRPVPDDGEI